jgi:hypothetical protein
MAVGLLGFLTWMVFLGVSGAALLRRPVRRGVVQPCREQGRAQKILKSPVEIASDRSRRG